jgi:hypothetical protein
VLLAGRGAYLLLLRTPLVSSWPLDPARGMGWQLEFADSYRDCLGEFIALMLTLVAARRAEGSLASQVASL